MVSLLEAGVLGSVPQHTCGQRAPRRELTLSGLGSVCFAQRSHLIGPDFFVGLFCNQLKDVFTHLFLGFLFL